MLRDQITMAGLLFHGHSLPLKRRLSVRSSESQRWEASALPHPVRANILAQCHGCLPPASGQLAIASRSPRSYSQDRRCQSTARRTPRPNVCVAASSFTIPEAGNNASNSRSSLAGAFSVVRAMMFYATTLALSVPLFITMLAMTPFVLLFDRHRRLWQHFVNNIWAKVSTSLFFSVQVEGREHLPRPDEPAVYVANHQSFMDIYSLFHLNRAFKFISKTSIFFFPIVGWSMFLTGHIKLNRTDRRSMMNCLLESQRLLKLGASVLFFPEGTRSTSGRIAAFKKGAFSVAAKAKVPVVPITIVGTGRMMPNKQEYRLFPGKAHIIIHPRIDPSSADAMLDQAFQQVAGSLPPELVA